MKSFSNYEHDAFFGKNLSVYQPTTATTDTPNFRALAQELVDAYVWCIKKYIHNIPEKDALVLRARAALATPPPEPPSEEDLLRLWQFNFGKTPKDRFMDIAHFVLALATPPPEAPSVMEIIELSTEIEEAGLGQIDLVRAALERWGK